MLCIEVDVEGGCTEEECPFWVKNYLLDIYFNLQSAMSELIIIFYLQKTAHDHQLITQKVWNVILI